MSNKQEITRNEKPTVVKKPGAPFNNDQHNNRGGKNHKKAIFIDSGGKRMKSISVPKFKGGSGGDR